jgi:hypothetical protein
VQAKKHLQIHTFAQVEQKRGTKELWIKGRKRSSVVSIRIESASGVGKAALEDESRTAEARKSGEARRGLEAGSEVGGCVYWRGGMSSLGSRKLYSGTMRERPTPSSAARISAVWYERCVMLGHSQQLLSQAPISFSAGAVCRTTCGTGFKVSTPVTPSAP